MKRYTSEVLTVKGFLRGLCEQEREKEAEIKRLTREIENPQRSIGHHMGGDGLLARRSGRSSAGHRGELPVVINQLKLIDAEVDPATIEASTNPPDCGDLQNYSLTERKK